jgi:GrpB-like predicted nucleotidyltransferase (UPF0157 family)
MSGGLVLFEEPALGLGSGEVTLVAYDPRWRRLFNDAAGELSLALGSEIVAVHHVGSTAVVGLCAKPVLDVLVSIRDFARALDLVPSIEAIGYEFRPNEEIPDRHYFRRFQGSKQTHHLSLAEPSSWHHRATLAFRDALRADPREAEAYAALKLRLAAQHPGDRPAYIEGKSAFVERVLAEVGLTGP